MFENSFISMAPGQEFTPRSKHIAVKYPHLREFVRKKKVQVISKKEQTAYIFTKPFNEDLVVYLRKKLNGW